MEWGIRELTIICPLVFMAGFVDAAVGGGGLISLPAYLFAGFPVHAAIATNKLSAGFGLAAATARYALKGYVAWRLAALCAACSLVGAELGARLALTLDDRAFKIIMLLLLPPTALYVLRGQSLSREGSGPGTRQTALSMAIAFALGAYDGFYGPGAGTFMLLLLTAAAGLSLNDANGISKVINLTSGLTSLAVFWANGKVLVPVGLIAGLFSLAGSAMGARAFVRGGAKVVRPLMLAVLCVFFVRVLLEVL